MIPVTVGWQHAKEPAAVVAAVVKLLAHRFGGLMRSALETGEGRDVRVDIGPKPASIRRSPLGCCTRIAAAAKCRLSRNDPPLTAKAARVSYEPVGSW